MFDILKHIPMKKIIITVCAICTYTIAFSQNNNANANAAQWRTMGNAASTSDFLGTTNSEPLILKSNNVTGMEIRPTGDVYFPTLGSSSGNEGLVIVGGDGHGGRIEILHNFSQVLNGQGIFTEISQLTGMKLSGNNILQTATGNIGIGTLTPASKLSVVGDGSFTGKVIATTLNSPSLAGVGDREVFVDANGNLKVGDPPPNPNLLVCSTSLKWDIGGNAIGGYMGFTPTPAAGTCDNFDFILKANGANYVWLKTDGKLGLGTSSPAARLDVLTSGNNKAFNISNAGTDLFSVNADGGTQIHLTNSIQSVPVLTMTHASGSSFKILANGTGDITSSSSFSPHFGTGPSDNFSIFQGVPGSGIKHFEMAGVTGASYFLTTDPNQNGAALMVFNNPNTNGSGTNNQVFKVNNDGSTTIYNPNPGSTSSPFTIQNTAGNLFQVDAVGNTQIKTNAFFSSGNLTDNILMKHDAINGLIDVNGTGGLLLNYFSGKDVDLCTGPSGFVKTGPNVQIGAVTQHKDPNIALNIGSNGSVATAINVEANGNSIFKVESDGSTVINGLSTSSELLSVRNQGNSILKIKPNGTIQSAGPLYLGPKFPYNFPNAMLTVDGSVIVSQDIWVADGPTGGWADYVFKKDYALMPLLDVEKYILENGHLKNVPSAAEIKEKGQNIGHLQTVQMEKIEEQTLYMIEIKKEMIEIKEEIKNLKKENEELKKKLK